MLYHVTGMSLLAEISGDLWLTRRDRDARSSVTKQKKKVVVTLSPSVPDTISDKRGQVQFAKYSLPGHLILTTSYGLSPLSQMKKKILFQFIDFQCRFLIYRWSIPYFNFLIFLIEKMIYEMYFSFKNVQSNIMRSE